MRKPGRTVWRARALTALALLAGCSSYAPRPLDVPAELAGVQTKSIGEVSVSLAILTDEQAQQHFGVDLAAHDLQALWARITNGTGQRLWILDSNLDRDIFSPDEAALLLRRDIPGKAYPALRQRLRDDALRVRIESRTVTEGFLVLPRTEGGRYVNVRLIGDVYEAELARAEGRGTGPLDLRFDFAVALPDGDFDYERLNPGLIYPARELPELDLAGLRAAVETLPCCVTNADGSRQGDPLNVVMVGEASQVLDYLSRAGWSFTHRIDLRTIRRELAAVITGDAYPVAPVSSLYALGRPHDLALQRARHTIAQRNHMRLWLAPFRYQGRPVWLGQVSRDIGVKGTLETPTLTTHVIDPEVDAAREYLLHSLMSQGLVAEFGFAQGAGAGTPQAPRRNLTDDPYFSDGMRLVLMLATTPVEPAAIRSLLWEQSGAPVAEGQTPEALRNVRPMVPVEATAP